MEWWQILIIIFFATLCAQALITNAKAKYKSTDESLDVILIDLMKDIRPHLPFYPDTAEEDMHLAKAKKRIQDLVTNRTRL